MTDNNLDISIRPLLAEDYDAVCELWQAAGLEARLTGRDARDAFEFQLQRFPTTYLGAEADGRLVGLVMGTHDHRKGWINRLAVHPDHQRRGVARALVAACERALRDGGIEIVSVLVEQDNESSRRLFERCDYLADVPVHYYRKRFQADI